MINKLISVIIPTYNRAKTIIACLDSVCNQTYSNIEIIVVDDCSTDDTREIITNYADHRVKYFCLDSNSGACVARNKGVELSHGEIIAFQDSDDIWHREKLEKQINFLIKGNFELVTCGFFRISEIKTEKIGYKKITNNDNETWCKLINGNWVSTQTIMCYKYCFDKILFDRNVKRFQDWDFALQAVKYFRIGAMNEYLVDVYVQKDSITSKNKAYDSMIYILDKHKPDFNDRMMAAQYYKSLGDVERLMEPRKAIKSYIKSINSKFDMKVLIVIIMCFTGIIKIYDKKYR